MMKRRSKISFISKNGLLFILMLTVAMPGCKKESPSPPPKATPLPKKTVQPTPAVSAGGPATAKPLQAAVSSAKTAVVKIPAGAPVQNQISSARKFTPPGNVNLDFTSRRDPFKPYAQLPEKKQPVEGQAPKRRGHDALPIQSFDTDKFRVSAIVTGLKENSALVTDPKGKGYVVKKGMLIGNNDGHVKRISDSIVEVEEIFKDDSGKARKRVVKLTLLRKK